jgi:hypothetical protein
MTGQSAITTSPSPALDNVKLNGLIHVSKEPYLEILAFGRPGVSEETFSVGMRSVSKGLERIGFRGVRDGMQKRGWIG